MRVQGRAEERVRIGVAAISDETRVGLAGESKGCVIRKPGSEKGAVMRKRQKVRDEKHAARQPQQTEMTGVFEPNAFYERLLEMREQNPSAFNSMSNATRFAVEAYTKAKRKVAEPQLCKAAA